MVHYLNFLDYQDKFCGKISPILLTLLPMCDIIIMGDKVNNQLHELLDELRSYDTDGLSLRKTGLIRLSLDSIFLLSQTVQQLKVVRMLILSGEFIMIHMM